MAPFGAYPAAPPANRRSRRSWAADGFNLSLLARKPEPLEATAAAVRAAGVDARVLALDLTAHVPQGRVRSAEDRMRHRKPGEPEPRRGRSRRRVRHTTQFPGSPAAPPFVAGSAGIATLRHAAAASAARSAPGRRDDGAGPRREPAPVDRRQRR